MSDPAGDRTGGLARSEEDVAPRATDDGRAGVLSDHQPAKRPEFAGRADRQSGLEKDRRSEGVKTPVDRKTAPRR